MAAAGGAAAAQRHRDTVNELYKPVRVNFPRRRTEIRSLKELQLDLGDMSWLAEKNGGKRFFLLAVNPFSKKFFGRAIQSKSAREVCDATKDIIRESGIRYKQFFSDRGAEFKNRIFRSEITQPNNIRHFFTTGIKKAAIVERGIGTVKRYLYKRMALRGSKRWIDDLQNLINEINRKKIARLGFAPNDVNEENEGEIYRKFYSSPRPYRAPKFAIGDVVRKSEPLVQFKRSFYPGWSPQIYKIVNINVKYPNVYKLVDYYGKPVLGSFYNEELQRVKHPNYFLIEKVIRRRGNSQLVKWLGYDETGWVHDRDFVDISDRRMV